MGAGTLDLDRHRHWGGDRVAIRGRRPVFFGSDRGFVEVPAYDGSRLVNGNVMVGPCIIEEPGTTIVVWPGQEALLDRYQNYIIEVGEA